ncbi:unnamed protein product, partial [Pocillopora meandrina]
MDSKEKEKESQKKSGVDYSFPISEYAKQLDFPVRDRYLQKIAAIGIDPVLVEGKDFKPYCLPPVESTDILCYLVLETRFYTQKQFKAFRSLEAYNQMVSGFIASVQGHIIADKFLVLAKVRHSQRMNDSLISCWVIMEREVTILFAHCLGCKAGEVQDGIRAGPSEHSLLSKFLSTKINGRLACTQLKCSWLLPTYVKQVEYEKVREINFTSARKMKNDLDAKIENLFNVSSPDNSAKGNVSKEIPVPSKPEMDTFYAKPSKSSSKPIALSLIPEYADSYILKSRCVPTISDLFDKKYLALSYPELLKAFLGRWYTRKHDFGDVKPMEAHSVCFCRTVTAEDTVSCYNANCPILKFHLSCLGICSIPKTWYYPNCRTLPEFKCTKKSTQAGKKHVAPSDALILDSICVCKKKPSETDKLLECHNEGCKNGRFFHLACVNLKRMPNTSKTTWVCPACKPVKQKSSSTEDGVKFVKEVKSKTPIEKYKQYAKLGQAEYDLIMSPTGWLDGTIIHEAQTILRQVN